VAYRRAVELAPEERAIQYAFGECLYRAGHKEEAGEALERATAPPDPVPDAFLVLGAVYEVQGRNDEALSALGRYLELRPDDTNARVLLGQHLTGARRHEEAIEVWKAGLVKGEPSPELFFRIGENLSRERDAYPEAETYLRQALQADPQHLKSQVLLGRILTRQGKTDEALEVLGRAAKDHPDSANVFYLLATLYQQLGKKEAAEEAGKRFRKLSEDSQERDHRDAQIKVTYKRARELLEQGKMTEAESTFESVLELDPDNVLARSMLAKIAYSNGRLDEARRWIAEALQRNDSIDELHYLNGLFASKAGRLDEAEPAVRRALELTPGFPDAWMLLGSVLADSGRHREAIDCYSRVVALEPANASVQLNLAAAYDALGRQDEEEEAMDRYRELTTTKEVNP
jgi:tetratricopeptide (TPR) repeat protein